MLQQPQELCYPVLLVYLVFFTSSVYTWLTLQWPKEQRYPVLLVYVVGLFFLNFWRVYLANATAAARASLSNPKMYAMFLCLPG